ncbi:MAG: 4Fe-4S dicluster domain-containing protein, partial [Bdellovibrionota bacterium]
SSTLQATSPMANALENQNPKGIPATEEISSKVGYDDLNKAYFQKSPRNLAPERSHEERKSDFFPVSNALSKNAYVKEAHRCFSCGVCNYCRNCELFCPDKSIRFDVQDVRNAGVAGAFAGQEDGLKSLTIDYDHCKGCGICVYECPRCAMDMAKE